jgi:hypothetical protein
MIFSLVVVSLFGCEVCRGYEQRIRDVYDGRIAVLSQASDQAGEGGNLCASSQVHEGHPVFCVSMRSFSGVAEDFTSAGR